MKTYFKRLKHHPGVPIAAVLSVTGILYGIIEGKWYAGLLLATVWIPVLLTAINQPIPENECPDIEDET